MITRMSKEEAYELLRSKRVARLGCIADGRPYVVPINYVFDDECVLSHSLPGRKVRAMRERPLVCLQTDDVRDQFNWQSVIAYGTFEEIAAPSERSRALNLLLSLFPRLTPVESFIAGAADAPSPIVYRVRIESITGLREG